MQHISTRTNIHLAVLFVLILIGLPISPAVSQGAQPQPIYLPFLARDYDPGWLWGDTLRVKLTPQPNGDVLMVVDRSGSVHLVWDVWPGSDAFIYHAYQTENGWSEPAKVANTLGTSEVLYEPLVTPDGRIHLLWSTWLGSGQPYRVMYAVFDGQAWSAEEEVAQFKYKIQIARLNYAENGDVNLLYKTSEVFAYYYHRVRTASGWSQPQSVVPDGSGPAILWRYYGPDRMGGVGFYGTGSLDNKQYYSYWRAGQLLVDRQVFSGQLSSSSFGLLERDDKLHLYRTGSVPIPGGSVTGLYHQCINSDLVSGPEKVLSGQGSIGSGVKTGWDSQNRVAFSWKPSSTGEFNLVILDRCAITGEKTGEFTGLVTPYTWGSLAAVATSSQPGKFCALAKISYLSGEYGLLCADIKW